MKSDDVDAHTKTNALGLHHARLDVDGHFVRDDEVINMAEEPGHDELCEREQAYFLKAIREGLNLEDHMADAVNSLRVVLAAELSIRTGKVVEPKTPFPAAGADRQLSAAFRTRENRMGKNRDE